MPAFAPNITDDLVTALGSKFRFRVEIEEQGGLGVATGYWLYASKNGGAYARVTTSTDLRSTASAGFADGAATTALLPTPGAGTFAAGAGDADGAVASITLAALGNTELEWSLHLAVANVGDVFNLRVYKSDGTALTSYPYLARVITGALIVPMVPRVYRQAVTRASVM